MYRFDIDPCTIKVLLERLIFSMHIWCLPWCILSSLAQRILYYWIFSVCRAHILAYIRWPANTWHSEDDDDNDDNEKHSLYSLRCDHPIFRLFSHTIPTQDDMSLKSLLNTKKKTRQTVVALYCIGRNGAGGSHHKTPYTNFVVTYFLHMKCVKWCH